MYITVHHCTSVSSAVYDCKSLQMGEGGERKGRGRGKGWEREKEREMEKEWEREKEK